jgi:hypothetical protein
MMGGTPWYNLPKAKAKKTYGYSPGDVTVMAPNPNYNPTLASEDGDWEDDDCPLGHMSVIDVQQLAEDMGHGRRHRKHRNRRRNRGIFHEK